MEGKSNAYNDALKIVKNAGYSDEAAAKIIEEHGTSMILRSGVENPNSPTKPKVRFVNLQVTPVSIYNPTTKRKLVVLPFSENGREKDGVYVVEGEEYRQFLAPTGPLANFPQVVKPIRPILPAADVAVDTNTVGKVDGKPAPVVPQGPVSPAGTTGGPFPGRSVGDSGSGPQSGDAGDGPQGEPGPQGDYVGEPGPQGTDENAPLNEEDGPQGEPGESAPPASDVKPLTTDDIPETPVAPVKPKAVVHKAGKHGKH